MTKVEETVEELIEDQGELLTSDEPEESKLSDTEPNDDNSATGEDNKLEDPEEGQEDEVVISIGEETPPQESKEAPEWVKNLRKKDREKTRQIKELERKLNEKDNTGSELKIPELGVKPKIEDFDYDSEKYETGLSDWFENKAIVDKENAKQKEAKDASLKEWENQQSTYHKVKTELKVKDYDEAEFTVQDVLSRTQQGVIITGADKPAHVIYALGKNPKKLKEISQIKDPVKFIFAVSKLETQLKVSTKRKPSTSPEGVVKGTSSGTSAIGATLDGLRKEATASGDYSKVIAYKNKVK